jgi:hypothetical protein
VRVGLHPRGLAPLVANLAEVRAVFRSRITRLGGRELRMFSTTTTFSTPVDITLAEIVIESYYPADEETAAYFTKPDGAAASKHRSR